VTASGVSNVQLQVTSCNICSTRR